MTWGFVLLSPASATAARAAVAGAAVAGAAAHTGTATGARATETRVVELCARAGTTDASPSGSTGAGAAHRATGKLRRAFGARSAT